MGINKNPAPSEDLKDLLYIGEDGLLHWHDLPENQRRFWKWGKHPIGANCKGNSYPTIKFNGYEYKAHQIMYWLKTGKWPVDEIDHIDQNRQNYRFENLRAASRSQNLVNVRDRKLYTTYITTKGELRYRVRVSIEGHKFSVGYYDDEQTALLAAWLIRDIVNPGFCPVPERLIDYIGVMPHH